MSAQSQPRLSPEAYLAREREAASRSEYFDGQMWAMAGGTLSHGQIADNFCAELRSRRGRGCIVTAKDTRLRVSPQRLYTYPDVMVVCGEPQFADDHRDTILNPLVVVEVLSKSTEAYDRGLKFASYRTLESLVEYVLLSQSEPRAEVFRRQADRRWLLTEFVGTAAECRLDSLDCSVPLEEIYYLVRFDDTM